MPSIGGYDNSRTKDCDLEDVTSLISVELVGSKSSSTSKNITELKLKKDKPIASESTTIMAPNKNGQMESECKTASSIGKEVTQQDKKLSAGTEKTVDPEGDTQCNGKPNEEQMEKTAEVKRKEYKEKPKASSVEILGLKKMKNARIPNQGHLDQSIYQSAESELRRRKSSPAAYHYQKHQRIPEEQSEESSVDKLATKMTQMDLSCEKKDGFEKRMEEEVQERNNLVSKGPTRSSPPQVRMQPYSRNQPSMTCVQPFQQPQQVHVGQVTHHPQNRQIIVIPNTKFVPPGMTPAHHTDGRTMQNVSRPQTTVTRNEPVESYWPPSPTDSCDPNSPGSVSSLSPAHTMQQAPSPAYSSAYSPAQPQLSPQSMMSPADSYQGMSTSPNSPYSPENMVIINSPPSVQSEDSGIASPPHNPSVYNYTSVNGTNSGVVIDNSKRPNVNLNQIPADKMRYIIQNRQQPSYQKQQQQPSQAEVALQSIERIKEDLMASTAELPSQQCHIPPDNYHYVQSPYNRNQVSQPMVSQQPAYQHTMYSGSNQMQMVTPPPTPQDHNRNLENLVNNMPLDVLCSLDEEGDSALHIAISQGNTQLVRLIINRLLKSGRRDALNLQDNIGQTPLHICIVTNQPNLIIELLKAGADIMKRNKEQVTVLHYAAAKGFSNALLAIFHCLCEKMIANIQIDIEDKNGMSPLQCAIQAHGRLARVYDGTQCMYVDKMVDSLDTIKNLLYLGADPSFQDRKSGYTAIHYAVELPPCNNVTPNTHILKIILEWPGVDARQLLRMQNYAGNTPLHVIAGREFDEDYVVSVIDHLISFGADIDVKNQEKQLPRDLATVKKKERPKVFARLTGDHLQGK
ncbi:NF-kappa-B inhibitor zeta-like [Lytechinus variegatus]|uniref:NF-kappa-B inhibitor zeta-like n=1 Tax=Lytechinus variegatus TaxID=7654 RepID=UPI001BB0E408|nr:NF-kappa-B inhibitor zeta-like [Lytechinus variegatus]